MKINDYVLVTKKDSDLYRRRCRIIAINDDTYTVYSEGLDETDDLKPDEIEKPRLLI